MAVYWNGDVPACCADFGEEYILGNLKETPLLELWNGERMRALRQLQVEGRAQEIEPCRGCDALWHTGGTAWHVFHGVEKLVQLTARPDRVPPAPPRPTPTA
jgi:radical SAM protein with 4Fe4S-binding SPASM domain